MDWSWVQSSATSLLAPLGVNGLERPGLGLLVLVAGLLALLAAQRRSQPQLGWSAMLEARAAGARGRELTPAAALLLRVGAIACLATVLAGPVSTRSHRPESGLGLDLALVLDTSASMRALDAVVAEHTRTRLELAKQAVARFAERRVEAGDRVSLVVFGSHAYTQSPLTGDGSLLRSALQRVRVGIAGESTALGDALALAVKRLSRTAAPSEAGRAIVLLTDGRSNAGAIPLDVATDLARGEGIRVHTVGIGRGGDEVPMAAAAGREGHGVRFERHDPDLESLERVAAQTGGRFFEAQRSTDLARVYAEIDSLERVERELPPRRRVLKRPEPLLAAAGGFLLLEVALARILRRRLPG